MYLCCCLIPFYTIIYFAGFFLLLLFFSFSLFWCFCSCNKLDIVFYQLKTYCLMMSMLLDYGSGGGGGGGIGDEWHIVKHTRSVCCKYDKEPVVNLWNFLFYWPTVMQMLNGWWMKKIRSKRCRWVRSEKLSRL